MAQGASAFAWIVIYFSVAWLVPQSTSTPIFSSLFDRDTGSSTSDYCTYDENPMGSCNGQPNINYCKQAIIDMCDIISTFPAGNNSIVIQQVGYGINSGMGADCVVAIGTE